MRGSAAISPTAHYTGYVWARNGLSAPAFATTTGRVLYQALQPVMRASAALGGPAVEGFLLARHRAIDALLTAAIEDGTITQVLEVAAGLSPRGWLLTRRYGDAIRYVEADLPAMAARKRRLLGTVDPTGLQVTDLDVLSDADLTAGLDTGQGLAIITEGLLNYFDRATVTRLWARFAAALHRFPHGMYLSDLHVAADNDTAQAKVFLPLLSAFVRGRVHLHFADAAEATAALRTAGFARAELRRPDGDRSARLVRVIAASTR